MYDIMTPGPTQVREMYVRRERLPAPIQIWMQIFMIFIRRPVKRSANSFIQKMRP